MERTCACCGEGFEGKTVLAKYCSERCKRRYHRGARPDADEQKPKARPKKKAEQGSSDDGVGSTAAAVLMQLSEAGRLHLPLAQAALVLAHRLDASHKDTGAGVASLAKQLEQTLDAALAGAEVEDDAVDELDRRRQEKLRAVGSG